MEDWSPVIIIFGSCVQQFLQHNYCQCIYLTIKFPVILICRDVMWISKIISVGFLGFVAIPDMYDTLVKIPKCQV